MTRRQLMLIAATGSLALLLGAFVFQALGYAPCKICIWQRWPHGAAIGAGVLVVLTGPLAIWGIAGALSALGTAGIGFFHAGVELKWWEGPTSCTGGGNALGGLSGDQLLSLDAPVNIVMCDEVTWALAGISMAGWNAIFSIVLAGLWVVALRRG